MTAIIIRLKGLMSFKDLLKQLVLRDIKLKYRRSVLGYLWSVLNPLLTMWVMVIVFSHLFRFDIPNFPVYLLSGQTLFNFMSEATSMGMGAIVGNASLLKKTYVPKYIFTFARVTSSLVNLLFTMAALFLVVFFTNVQLTPYFLLFPLVLAEVYIFSLGLAMLLSAANVFFRDIQYLWGVFLTMWTYLTPLFYPVTIIPEQYRFWYERLNPMYCYIAQFRNVVLYGKPPLINDVLLGTGIAFFVFLIGSWYFFRRQDNFILYI